MAIHASASIHPAALVEDGAVIGQNCEIGAFAHVGPDVTLGDGCILKSHAVVAGWTEIGEETTIYPFASIGHAPQDLKYAGERTKLEIGAKNRIREGATLSPGTKGGGGVTKIGDNNLLMVNSHIGHDCILGSNIVVANGVSLAGHVIVEDNVIMGGHSGIHQFCRIGTGAMLAGFAAVAEDVIPFGMVHGNRADLTGLNLVGLKRRGYDKADIHKLRAAFKDVFHQDTDTLQQRLAKALIDYPDSGLVAQMVAFAQSNTSRGICTPKGR
jgi:UDP-N-acetylglucosamine acyltransferase